MELDISSHRTGVSVAAVPNFDRSYEGCHVEMFRALVLVLGDRDLAAEAMDESFARAFERWVELVPVSVEEAAPGSGRRAQRFRV
jgi:hypothetical protein